MKAERTSKNDIGRKRVLMLLENSTYLQDTRVKQEASALAKAGYRISVICPRYSGHPWHEKVDGVDLYYYPPPPDWNSFWGYVWEYGYSLTVSFALSLAMLKRGGFDIVHAHCPPDTSALIGGFYKLFGKRFVYDHHDLAPEMYNARARGRGNRLVHRALVWLEKLACRFADHVIATNESYRRIEIARDDVPESHITIVRNGPGQELLDPAEPYPGIRQDGKTIIGYVGIIGIQDGVDSLLRAIYHLVHDLGRTDFICLLVGSGDALDGLKSLANELQIADYLVFTGFVPYSDVPRYLSAMDICVAPEPSNPYNDSSTIVKIMEYMAAGKPIVSFDLPEHHYSAQGGAVFVTPNDEREFAQAVAQLMDDPAWRERLGQAGKKRIQEKLSWQYSVPNLLQAYNQVHRKMNNRQELTEDMPSSSNGFKTIRRLSQWLGVRNPRYIRTRLAVLLSRYGLTSGRATRRTRECVDFLNSYGCPPTFPTPGRVIGKKPEFFRELQQQGVEFSIHGYDHVDFRGLTHVEAKKQFDRAADVFEKSGIKFEGFRCPYLSYTDELETAADGRFRYSSNKAIWWDVVPQEALEGATSVFDQLRAFYKAESHQTAVATPHKSGHWVEIPVSVPDDLQLYDGLRLGSEGLGVAWTNILCESYKRGELFVLMFHPESFPECRLAFEQVLKQAQTLTPAVWLTQLREISRWWWEKSEFQADISSDATGNHITFRCSERATILLRNVNTLARVHTWDDSYQVLEERRLDLPLGVHPFIGIAPDVSEETVSFLQEQGYILDRSEQAADCALYLDKACESQLGNPVALVEHIEASLAPLVRFWRWPNEAKSALCLTGDLDALSLMDYASRLFMV